MNVEKKIRTFQEKILAWYKANGRKFHWRKKNLSSYQYIIAEVLLQRTKAETIDRFYIQFITTFPDWKSLANAPVEEIATYIRPIGLYTQRSIRLQSLAVEMVKRKGKIPTDRSELESIPFMGQYIANAVELIIFNQPSPLVDVNMARVLERVFGPRTMADIRYDPYLQSLAKDIVSHSEPQKINWAILDFAALVCKARSPLHSQCPLKNQCVFFKNQAELISKQK